MNDTPLMSRRIRRSGPASGMISRCASGEVVASSSPSSVTTWMASMMSMRQFIALSVSAPGRR
jgi:hypothetical protein